tara:strand:+ start:354 stop:3326 length:2973 start_codon:yes stop_codon:yes gene_type:complete
MPEEKIIIRFEPDGDRPLVDAIEKLDKATKSLLRVQAQLTDKERSAVQIRGKHAKQIESLKIKVRALGGEWKKNTQIQGLVKRALKGNRIAMEQLRIVTGGYRRELVKTGAAQLLMVRNNRILGGSIAVARSKMLVFSFAIATTIRPLMNLIKMAGDADETLQKFKVVFGDVSKAMGAWATDFGGSIGYAESTLQGFASTFQDTFVPLGFAREEAARFSKTLTELAIDVASFSNKLDADVVRDFQSAMVGNHETVKKYGVIINEASLKQKAYEMGLTTSIQELTTMQKTEARLQMIIDGSSDAYKDKIRTMESYNNQLIAFREQAKKTGEEVGRALMPLAKEILTLMSHLADTSTIYGYVTALGVLGAGFLGVKIRAMGAAAAMKTFRLALIKTGVGAAVLLLAELIAHVIKTGEGYDKAAKDAKSFYDSIDKGDLVLKSEADLLEELAKQTQDLDRLQKQFDYRTTMDAHGKMTTVLIKEANAFDKQNRESIIPQIKLREANIKVIQEELSSRGQSVGTVSNEAKAIEALAKAYKASKKGKTIDLEATIEMITAALDVTKLTDAQVIGLEHLNLTLKKLKETKTSLTEEEKNAQSALKATVGAQREVIQATIEELQAQLKAGTATNNHAEAIKNLQTALTKLGMEDLTQVQKDAQSALEGTLILQRAKIEATIAELKLQIALGEGTDAHTEAIKNQKKALEELGEVPKTETEKAIEQAIRDTIEAQKDSLKLLIAEMKAQVAAGDGTKYHAEAIKNLKEELESLGETTSQIPEWVEGATEVLTTLQIGFDAFSQTAQMYFANQQAGWDREVENLKNSDKYKRASTRQREVWDKELADKQRSAKQTAWKQQRALNMSQVVMDTASAIMSIWAQVPKFDFGISAGVLSGIVATMGAAQLGIIGSQTMPKFQRGGDFIVPPGFDNDTFPMLVESGERVRVTPKRNVGGTLPAADSAINITFSGNVMSDDFIVDEAIPKIKEALRRGADIGIS